MNDDVLVRLAAANPIPTERPMHLPEPLRVPRRAVGAIVLAVAVAVPAAAFAGKLGDLLGISNEGTPVSTSQVLPGQDKLDQALADMKVGSTMQLLGTLNGVSFYAARNADGQFCFAIDHVVQTYEKGVLCDMNADNFPSPDVKAISFPRGLQGIAADGVATVALLDRSGAVIDSTPVTNNLFVSDERFGPGDAAYLETLDAEGNVLTKQPLPGG